MEEQKKRERAEAKKKRDERKRLEQESQNQNEFEVQAEEIEAIQEEEVVEDVFEQNADLINELVEDPRGVDVALENNLGFQTRSGRTTRPSKRLRDMF